MCLWILFHGPQVQEILKAMEIKVQNIILSHLHGLYEAHSTYCKLLLKSNFRSCKNTVVNCWLKLAPSLSYKSIITHIKEKQTRQAKNLLGKRKKMYH